MSLIDPTEPARQKNANRRGAPSTLVVTLLFGLGALLAVGLIGFGAGGLIDQVRVMSLNSVFGSWETNIPVETRGLAIPLGILGAIFFLAQYGKWNRRFTGRDDRYAVVGPLTIVLIGLALGVWVSTTMWVAPDAIGVALDPTFGEDEPWGTREWVLYSAKWWMPGVLGALALASLVASFIRRIRRGALRNS